MISPEYGDMEVYSLLAQIPPTPSFPATSFSSLPHELIIYIAEMVLETTSIISLLRLNQHFLSLLQPLAHRSSLLCDDPVSSIKYTPMTHLIWIAIRPPLHPFIKDLTIWIEDPDLLPTIATLLLRLPALHTLDVECSSEETVRLEYFWPIVRQVKTLVKLSLVTEMTLTAELNIAVDLPLLRSLATECPQYFPGKRNITHLDWTIRTPLQNVDRSLNKFDSLKSLTFKGRYGNEMPLPNFSRWTTLGQLTTLKLCDVNAFEKRVGQEEPALLKELSLSAFSNLSSLRIAKVKSFFWPESNLKLIHVKSLYLSLGFDFSPPRNLRQLHNFLNCFPTLVHFTLKNWIPKLENLRVIYLDQVSLAISVPELFLLLTVLKATTVEQLDLPQVEKFHWRNGFRGLRLEGGDDFEWQIIQI